MSTTPAPTDLPATRRTLQTVATHVLARRRAQVTGKFGLRAAPGGFATPAFGDGPEVVRVTGTTLVREVGGTATAMALAGATLRELATFAGADLDADFQAGGDTPPTGDPDIPLAVDPVAAAVIADWFALAWTVLDTVAAASPGPSAVIQLWPEHFDAATVIEVGGDKANVGFSPGDGDGAPYLYVGPWSDRRPGPQGYWNAPFGATLAGTAVVGDGAPAACTAFLQEGLGRLDR